MILPFFYSFPRFYFIGDDDLLQILGQASKPAVIQTHMKKLFAGIYNVNFDEENKHIVSMNSIEGRVSVQGVKSLGGHLEILLHY